MSERKVLNKYYPPDFDPNKIPKLKRPRNRQFNIRIMAPFNMRCGTCGEYIYKGKKFNSRQEKVEDEDYLGLMIFRFYIKCPRCVSEISFKTDPKNTDYELEAGATRNFEALRTAEILAERELKEKEDEEKDNPMKVLENRTKASRQEMEMIETLEELRELNSRHAKVDHENMIELHKAYEEQLKRLQEDEDEDFIRSIFGKSDSGVSVKRVHDDDEDEDDFSSSSSTPKLSRPSKPSDLLVQESDASSETSLESHDGSVQSSTKQRQPISSQATWQKSVGSLRSKKTLSGLVRKKPATEKPKPPPAPQAPQVTIAGKSTENQKSTVAVSVQNAASSEKADHSDTVTSNSSKGNGPKDESKAAGADATPSGGCKLSAGPDTTPSGGCKPSGLSLLGAYSDSDSQSDSDT